MSQGGSLTIVAFLLQRDEAADEGDRLVIPLQFDEPPEECDAPPSLSSSKPVPRGTAGTCYLTPRPADWCTGYRNPELT